MIKPKAHRWIRLWQVVYTIGVALALGYAISSVDAAEWAGLISLRESALFAAGWLLMAASLGFGWALVVRHRFGLVLSARGIVELQSAAWSGRYLPGKLGLLAGRFTLVAKGQLSFRQLACSVMVENALCLGAGVLLILLVSPPWIADALGDLVKSWARWVFEYRFWSLVVWTLIVLLVLRVLARWFGSRQHSISDALLLVFYVLPHVAVGTGFHFFVLRVVEHPEAVTVAFSIGLLTAAHVAGMLAVFAPAGLGIREAVIALGLSPMMAPAEALAVAAVLRVTTLLADGLLLLVGLLMARGRKADASGAGPGSPASIHDP